MDMILNGQAHGSVAQRLMQHNFDVRALRPYVAEDGNHYITKNVNGVEVAIPVGNATASLRKDDWIQLDEAIVRAAQPRLQAVADLRSRGLTYSVPNGMGKTILETEKQSDITDAILSMDGLRESDTARPQFDLAGLPLPIIHKDFQFSARYVMASRNGGSPLDTTTAELAGRKVAEYAEKLLLGVAGTYAYGGGTVYGYTNFADRLTKAMTLPTASGWTGATFITELLAMRQLLQAAYHYGPYVCYNSPNWDQYLDQDYSTSKGSNTVRERAGQIAGIETPRTLDYLTGYTILLVQMTSDVVREVIGMDITTVQWESKGGMQLNFKVMAILVPQLRSDINSRTGICHGTAS